MTDIDVQAQPSPRATARHSYRRLSALVGLAAALAMGPVAIGCSSNSKTTPSTTTTTTTTTTTAPSDHHHRGGGGGGGGGGGTQAPSAPAGPGTVTQTDTLTATQTDTQTATQTATQTVTETPSYQPGNPGPREPYGPRGPGR